MTRSLKLRVLTGYLILFKVAYITLLSAVLVVSAPHKEHKSPSASQNAAASEHVAFRQHFLSFDSGSYIFLSEKGYKHGTRDCAYYPLFPLLIRWGAAIVGGHYLLVGMGLANAFSLVAFLLFFDMAARRYGTSVATWALVLLLVFPGSIFFQFTYSESLFFLLLMLLLRGLEAKHLALALVAAFLLPLTRGVGIFCAIPLAWHLFSPSQPTWRLAWATQPGQEEAIPTSQVPSDGLSTAVPPQKWTRWSIVYILSALVFGWVVYFLLMLRWTGNAFEGIEAQKAFGVESIHNLFAPVRFITLLLNPTHLHEFRGSLLDRCVFILLINCFFLIWKLDKHWCVWAFSLGVLPAVSGGFTSYTRFASVVFPLFIALGVLFTKPEMRLWRWLVFAVFATLHLVLVWRFVNFGWAG